jgi:hypothetical protein
VKRFRDHFAGHEGQYVLIGGAACELVMDDVGLNFRATKDLDTVAEKMMRDWLFFSVFPTV